MKSEAATEAEVTFVLTDIVSSTPMWERDPLAMDAAVARHDALVRQTVEAHNGTLIRHRGEGDSTFSTFDDPVDAIAAAADLVRVLALERWHGDLTIRVRTGIHTGTAIHRAGDLYGPSVNRAARLRGLAEEQQVLVSATTAARARERLPTGLTLVDRGDHALKGIDQPETILEVIDERQGSRTVAGTDSLVASPLPPEIRRAEERALVGRDDVLTRLGDRWSEARSGRRRAVLLAGEPGQGKSRLARELARSAHRDGAVVLYAAADDPASYGLGPIGAALTQLIRSLDPIDARRIVAEDAGMIARLDPSVARHLGVDSGSADRSEIGDVLESVGDIVERVAAMAPVVAVIDDIHRADPATLEFIARMAQRDAELRLLLVLTYRDAEVPPDGALSVLLTELDRTGGTERVRLDGLDRESVRSIVAELSDDDEEATRAADVLFAATQGNPLFLTELVRDEQAASVILAARDPEDLFLPESVRELVIARVERLSPPTARALRAAAVLGPEVDHGVLAEVAGTAVAEVLDFEESWLDAGLVREVSGGRVAFTHALVRQSLVEDVPEMRRRRLHARAAAALEARAGADLVHIARHWIEAGEEADPYRVARAAERGAEVAVLRFAFDEAERLIEAGLHTQPDDRVGAQLFVLRAEIALQRGLIDVALEHAVAAAARAREAGDAVSLARAALARFNGYTVMLGGEDPGGMALHEEALAALDDAAPTLRSRLLANLANHLARRGGQGFHATPLAEDAVTLAERSGDAAAVSHALRHWLQVRQGAPDVRTRLERCDDLVAAAQRTGDRWEIAQALQRRAGTRLELGDRERYEADVADAERRASRVDTLVARYEVRFRRVLRALLDGRFADAERHLAALAELIPTFPSAADAWAAQTMMLYREKGTLEPLLPVIEDALVRNPALAGFRVALVTALADTGRFDEARRALHELANDEFALAPRDSSWPTLAALSAEVSVRTGELKIARQVRDLLAPYSGLVLVAYESICVGAADRFLGMIDAALGDPNDASFEAAVELETRLGAPPLIARTRFWQAQSRVASGELVAAKEAMSEAMDLADQLGMTWIAVAAAATGP